MTATYTLKCHRNNGTPVGVSWTVTDVEDIDATLNVYRLDSTPVTVTITDAAGAYVGMAQAGNGEVLR